MQQQSSFYYSCIILCLFYVCTTASSRRRWRMFPYVQPSHEVISLWSWSSKCCDGFWNAMAELDPLSGVGSLRSDVWLWSSLWHRRIIFWECFFSPWCLVISSLWHSWRRVTSGVRRFGEIGGSCWLALWKSWRYIHLRSRRGVQWCDAATGRVVMVDNEDKSWNLLKWSLDSHFDFRLVLRREIVRRTKSKSASMVPHEHMSGVQLHAMFVLSTARLDEWNSRVFVLLNTTDGLS